MGEESEYLAVYFTILLHKESSTINISLDIIPVGFKKTSTGSTIKTQVPDRRRRRCKYCIYIIVILTATTAAAVTVTTTSTATVTVLVIHNQGRYTHTHKQT